MSETMNEQVEEIEEEVEEVEETAEVVDETAAKIEELTNEIEELKKQLTEAKNDYYKAYADAENRKKRLQQDFDTNMKYRIQSFALEVLPVIDNLERALAQQTSDESFKKGVEMIYQQLIHALKNEGVEVIDALNKPFDPNFHHAIMQEAVEGVESNMVVEVLQKGYVLKDRVIRPSYVKVSE